MALSSWEEENSVESGWQVSASIGGIPMILGLNNVSEFQVLKPGYIIQNPVQMNPGQVGTLYWVQEQDQGQE